MDLKSIPTCNLVNELKKREGVSSLFIEPYEEYAVRSGSNMQKVLACDTGPAIVLVVID